MKKTKRIYGEIAKSEQQDDGTLKVWGYASSGAVDSDGEIITPQAMKGAIANYMKFGAVREMHGNNAAGTAIEIEVKDDGKTWFGAHVIDPVAVKKCETGVYKGFSIGGKVKARNELNKAQIEEIDLIEISLVDRPANPEALFEMFKAEKVEEDEEEDTEDKEEDEKDTEEASKSTEEDEKEKSEESDDEDDTDTETEDEDDDKEKSSTVETKKADILKQMETLLNEYKEAEKLTSIDKSAKNNNELSKYEDLQKSYNDLVTKAEKLEKDNEDLTKRIKELEAMPKPKKASLLSVNKSNDILEEDDVKISPVIKSNGEVDEVATLMKQAFANGAKRLLG